MITLQVWNITALVAIALFFASAIIMIISGFTRNRYYQEPHADELIKATKTSNSKNALYFTSGETSRFIKKYVLCKSGVDKYAICNYNKPYKSISFFIMCYKGKRKRPFKVLKYSELKTGIASKVISIPKKTRRVNIIISETDKEQINQRVIKPLSIKKIRLFSFYSGLAVFTGLYALRHIISYLITTDLFFETFLNSLENYGLIFLTFIFSIIIMIVAKRSNKRKNKKTMSGGAIEYDFL